MNKNNRILLLVVLVFLVMGLVLYLVPYLNLSSIKANQNELTSYVGKNFFNSILIFGIIYVLVTGLLIPGAVLLTLTAGALFGVFFGTIIVSFASTLGAALAFTLSRSFFRASVIKWGGDRLKSIDEGFQKDGAFYLFGLRLAPIFPFFVVNSLCGVTSMSLKTFYWVSQIGMLPGTVAYVNAGTQLSSINSLSGILSSKVIVSFVILGLLPLILKKVFALIESHNTLKKFKKPSKYDYNLIVIGAGSGGLVSAYSAAAMKAKVALIERHKMGGDCLNTGCVPSKALLRSAKIATICSTAGEFGISASKIEVDFSKVMQRVDRIIKTIEPNDSVERYSKLGVECHNGSAKINSPYEVEVNGKILTTKAIIVATGGAPLVPPIPGLSEINFYTSDTIWSLIEAPKTLVVLGGGPIGVELAQAFVRLGSKVVLIEKGSQLLPKEDLDSSEVVKAALIRDGVRIFLDHQILEFRKESSHAVAICSDKLEINCDAVLVCLGREGRGKGFGLEELGISINENGTIPHDDYLRTSIPNIFVCGDVAGPYQFTHTASYQAFIAAFNALIQPVWKLKPNYRVIPWCTFTEPELARVGLSEWEAKAKNLDFTVTKYEIDDLDRAITEGAREGFVKVITQGKSDKILGATIVGAHAGDLIIEFILAMKHGLGLNKLLGTIHIYPTFVEANRFVAGQWRRSTAPKGALEILKKFHYWRRN